MPQSVIYKQILNVYTGGPDGGPTDTFEFKVPVFSKLLHVDNQHDYPTVWFLIPDVNQTQQHTVRLRVIGTGLSFNADSGEYLGTVLLRDGTLVLHVWDMGVRPNA